MALALVLALIAMVLTVLLRDVPKRAAASVKETSAESSAGPLIRGESPVKPWRERTRHIPTPEISKDEANPGSSEELKSESAPDPKAEPRARPEPLPQPEPQAQAQPEPQAQAQPEPKSGQPIATVGESGWQRPTPREIEAANEPRHYDLPAGAIMGLTMDSIGIHDAPVFDSDGPDALASGVAHVPGTSWPWSPTPQRNVYLAGHRMGYRGTWSRMLFYNLDKLGEGDRVVLRDRRGRTYAYRVSDAFLVDPTEQWVTGQIRGRDMLTLQTCTPIPTFEKRLIVRAERV